VSQCAVQNLKCTDIPCRLSLENCELWALSSFSWNRKKTQHKVYTNVIVTLVSELSQWASLPRLPTSLF